MTPVVVRARFFSKTAERRIKAVGGVCELIAWYLIVVIFSKLIKFFLNL